MIMKNEKVICRICGRKRVIKNMIISIDSKIPELRMYECNTEIRPHNLTTLDKKRFNY